MKKPLLIILMTFMIMTLVAQGQKPFRFGMKIGPNLDWLMSGTDSYKNDGTEVGFSWGFISDFTLAENYFLSTGFNLKYNYARLIMPYRMEDIDTTGTLNRKYKLRYFEVPLMVKMRTNNFGDFAFFGQLGLTGDVLIAARGKDVFTYRDKDGTTFSTPVKESTITSQINALKAGFVIGLGAEYFIDKSTSILVSVNYNNGLTNVLHGQDVIDPSIDQRAQLHYVELNVGVIF
jgi:hypothetical protein